MDLESLSIPELERLIRDAGAAAEKKRATHRRDVRKRCMDLIKSEGLTLSDVFPETAAPASPKGPTFPIANPANPAETYTGKGRKPAWLTQALLEAS